MTYPTAPEVVRRPLNESDDQIDFCVRKDMIKKDNEDTRSGGSGGCPLGRSAMGALVALAALAVVLAVLAAAPADEDPGPEPGFVASNSTFKDAMACNCVAFSSTLPIIHI